MKHHPRHNPLRRHWPGHALIGLAAAGAAILLTIAGCAEVPPPPRVPIPATSNRDTIRDRDYVKPMPPEDNRIDLRVDHREVEQPPAPAPSQPDAPPAPQREAAAPPPAAAIPAPAPDHATPPAASAGEAARVQKDFVDAYRQVGQPHFVVYVNRTLDGQLLPDPSAQAGDRPPGADPLKPEQYDPAAVGHSIDLAALESHLAEQMSCDKQVTVIPPATVHEKLTDPQVRDLESGRASALATVDQNLNADVLIQVQVQPMKVSGSTTELRLLGEVINVRGGQVIGHAIADIDHPQDADQLKGATQYLTRKLMIDMLRAWTAPPPGNADSSSPAPRP